MMTLTSANQNKLPANMEDMVVAVTVVVVAVAEVVIAAAADTVAPKLDLVIMDRKPMIMVMDLNAPGKSQLSMVMRNRIVKCFTFASLTDERILSAARNGLGLTIIWEFATGISRLTMAATPLTPTNKAMETVTEVVDTVAVAAEVTVAENTGSERLFWRNHLIFLFNSNSAVVLLLCINVIITLSRSVKASLNPYCEML